MDDDKVLVVELHRDNYGGKVKSELCATVDAAMHVADEYRDEHRGDDWRMDTGDRGLTFHPTGDGGWVCVREQRVVQE